MELTTLQETVASTISGSGDNVAQKVVDFFVQKETDRRVTALTAAVTSLEADEKSLLKIKPDQQSYNADGTVAQEFYSKAKIEERKKLTEKIEKLKKAVSKALEKNDFGDLFNVAKPEGEKSDKTAAPKADSTASQKSA